MEPLIATSNTETIGSFLTKLALEIPKLDALRMGMELFGATRFSPFEIFSPDENTLSRVIAELLDPYGSHGQGALFANAILSELGYSKLGTHEVVRVRREAMTKAGRRIDIVIETLRYVIGIENKPWAKQSARQLEDYYQELQTDLRGRTPILIFLSDQEPETAMDTAHRLTYTGGSDQPSLPKILRAVLPSIRAAPPRRFVEDFIRYMDNVFGNGQMNEEFALPYTESVIEEYDDTSKRKAISAVLIAQNAIHTTNLNDIGKYILSKAEKESGLVWETGDTEDLGEALRHQYEPWGLRLPHWPPNCLVAIEAQGQRYERVILGVKAPDSSKISTGDSVYASPANSALAGINMRVGGRGRTDWWPTSEPLYGGIWNSEFSARLILESPTSAIADHYRVQEIANRLLEIALVVDELLRTPPA
jgi:hypothetical protein